MPPEVDDRYLRYVVARLAAFRNVWWSVANEWDLVKGKKTADWDRYFRILQESDPYGRLRSIHHSGPMYDPDRKSTRLNSSHRCISYAVFCLKKNNGHAGGIGFHQDKSDLFRAGVAVSHR